MRVFVLQTVVNFVTFVLFKFEVECHKATGKWCSARPGPLNAD